MKLQDKQNTIKELYNELKDAKETGEPIDQIERDIIELEDMSLAEYFSKDNDLDDDINQAYIDIVGEEYADSDDVAEAYQGEYDNDQDFAYEIAQEIGAYLSNELAWPVNCIDWEQAAKELMFDYFESNGYYFRNL